MSGYEDQSHRFVITGEDSEGHPHTILLWRETDLVNVYRTKTRHTGGDLVFPWFL
jgi:hypothetical protein